MVVGVLDTGIWPESKSFAGARLPRSGRRIRQRPRHTTSTPFTYRGATVTMTSAEGNLTVTPTDPVAVVGRPITVTVSWSGVDATTPYLGWVEYRDGSGTIVKIN